MCLMKSFLMMAFSGKEYGACVDSKKQKRKKGLSFVCCLMKAEADAALSMSRCQGSPTSSSLSSWFAMDAKIVRSNSG